MEINIKKRDRCPHDVTETAIGAPGAALKNGLTLRSYLETSDFDSTGPLFCTRGDLFIMIAILRLDWQSKILFVGIKLRKLEVSVPLTEDL
jgi:hypothetical protein